MYQILLIKLTIIGLVIFSLAYFIYNFNFGSEVLATKQKLKTIVTSFIANFFDTFGIGSFSSIFAFRNLFNLMPDSRRYNGTLVIQAILPTALQSLLFLQLVQVDLLTLVVSCVMLALGGMVGSYLVKLVSRQTIYMVMLITFMITAILLVFNQLHWLNIGGDLIQVRGAKLILLGLIMFSAGGLPAFGVGYYSLVLIAIFLLGLSPVVAYPIMTTASTIQMPTTALSMIKSRQFYSLSALLMGISGAVAVFFAVPIISKISGNSLKWILLVVLIYNISILLKNMLISKKS
jgi:uncharacterized membrane protein YfcA